jgi:hypothetical protein
MLPRIMLDFDTTGDSLSSFVKYMSSKMHIDAEKSKG